MLKVAINTTILTLLHACRKHKNSSFFQIVFKSSSSVTDLHLTTNNKFWQGYNVSILPWPYNKSLSNDFKVDDDDFVFFISLFSCLYPSSLVYIPLFLFISLFSCLYPSFLVYIPLLLFIPLFSCSFSTFSVILINLLCCICMINWKMFFVVL